MSLLVWLPLTKDTMNHGVSSAIIKDNGSTEEPSGKLGSCRYLNGKTLTVTNFTDLQAANNFSACCWIKFTTLPSSSSAYCICLNGSTSSDYKFILGVYSTDGVTASFRLNGGNSTGTLALNTWYHLAICVSDTTGYMYIDGELVKTAKSLSSTNTATNLVIGGRSNNTSNTSFKGVGGPACYNDVRIYDHCLAPREVKQLAQGLVLHYPMNNDNYTNLLSQSYNFKNSATGKDPTYGFNYKHGDNTTGTSSKDFQSWGSVITANLGDIYTLSFYAKSDNSTGLTTFLYNNVDGVQISNIVASANGTNGTSSDGNCRFKLTPQWQKCCVTYTFNGKRNNVSTALPKTLLFRALAGDCADIAMPKLERGAIATPYALMPSEKLNALKEFDCSGFGNHGTRSTALSYVSNQDGRYSNATSFTSGERIRCNSFSTTGWKDLTMAAWVCPRDTANNTDINTIIIGGAYLAIRTSNNRVTTYCYGMNPTGYHTGKTALPLNTWSHIAAVWDSKNGVHKIYVNGEEDFSVSCTGTSSNGDKKDFGLENDSGRPYKGEMADARIYATALSAADIKTLYKSSVAMLENGVFQAAEFNEEPGLANLKMHKTGSIKGDDISEIGYTSGMKTKVLSDGSAWARIHWLNLTTDKTVFANDAEVAFCNKTNRFSRLGLVDHFKSIDGAYEFMLTYPSLSATAYNRWSQTSSPNVAYGSAEGFTKITTAWTSHFNALTKSNSSGSATYSMNAAANWWAPIGQKTLFNSTGIPAADGSTQTETELWVRIDNLPKLNKISMLDNKSLQALMIQEI